MIRNGMAACLLLVSFTAASAQSNDPFLRKLTPEGALDRRGLAVFMGRVSASLEKGREGVGFLGVAVEAGAPDKPYAARASGEMRERFQDYERALDRFSAATASLRKTPASELRLFRVLASGQRVCWLLESQINLAESYGANPGRLSDVRASGSACSTFHHVVSRAEVNQLVERALSDDGEEAEWLRENRELKEELHALEKLIEDLLAIDAD